ncbi:hypothetical protein O7627_12350 [Solwaraspora sp. WMMD1047]|uniref:hypothetical protein n=1 Tax=Solwaraspora sp. WMMD1047 TaxID=3016102 RepID=UPI002417319A|nr:hypothetical protein [Solwaraspora sp. WMMD1047]MDG4830088.1 hypothetical protein [Solwaraspora sp. WMMD1047]
MRAKVLFTAAIAMILALPASASVASADDQVSKGSPTVGAPETPTRVSAADRSGTQVIYDVGCWTTFRPPAPGGAPMTHYYANCANTWVIVCPAVTVNGVQTVYYNVWKALGPYPGVADHTNTAVWYYAATIPNGNYTTVFC